MINEEEYLISELADKAKVTVRTIRYYMDLGLLPPPISRDKYAHFDQEHLDRLELIKRLKNMHLPLEEIKQIVNVASRDDLSRLLKYQDQLRGKLPLKEESLGSERPGKDAMDYISGIIHFQSSIQEYDKTNSGLFPGPGKDHKKILRQSMEEETWERIHITKGVELHVRMSADRSLRAKISELVKFSQELFKHK